MVYNKPPENNDILINKTESRGLVIPDKDKAKRYFQYIGYFRLTAYFIPFQSEKDKFDEGITFDNVLALYIFDRKLRLLVMDAIERIEVAFRSVITNYMATRFNDPFWYADRTHFQNHDEYNNFINSMRQSLRNNRSKTFIRHYNMKYSGSTNLPSWMLMEILTMGTISKLFTNLRAKYKRPIAKEFNIKYNYIEQFIHHITIARNKCAHHSRFWNDQATSMPKHKAITDSLGIAPTATTFTQLSIIRFMLSAITTNPSWPERLRDLITTELPENICIDQMGFPPNWETRGIWEKDFR